MTENKKQIDICLCTFRRPGLLKETLASISRQKLPENLNLKVFVVDNDAEASGKSVCDYYIKQGLLDLRYDVESEQNIALARNRTVRMGRGELIAFIDDDEVAENNWIDRLFDSMQKCGADAVFGPVIPIYPENAPGWVRAAGLMDRPRYETGTQIYWGATNNTLVKRSLIETHDGPFDPAFGLTGGSDSALFRKLARDGAKLIWCDEAIVSEVVPKERMTFRFLKKRAFRGGQSFARIFLADASFVSKIFWFVKRLLYSAGFLTIIPITALFGFKHLLWAIRKLYLNLGQLSVLSGQYYFEYKNKQ